MERAQPRPQLLARDRSLWVLDKPSGLRVHAAGDDGADDLVSWVRRELDGPAALAPVHRLDAGTSGVVLLSSDAEERTELGEAFAAGTVRKRYLALTFGVTHAKGTIDRALMDARRKRPLEARTRYKRLSLFGRVASYLALVPESGRKHQLRRHLQQIGHGIIGDTRYRDAKRRRVPRFPGRLWLHAETLELPDGRRFEAPLASELAEHLEQLEALFAQ
jgi:23S rRNA-/tRNA-specific pseudouridylate synthase